jgi:branched-chain amino acid transport system substrate-binding protein
VEAIKSLDRKGGRSHPRQDHQEHPGDATFLPNGQLQPRYVVFKVVDGKNAKFEALQ